MGFPHNADYVRVRVISFVLICWIMYAVIIMKAIIAMKLEMAIKVMSFVKIKAIEIATRKTLMYRLALLLKRWENSVRIILLYLISNMTMDVKAKNMIMNV